MTKFFQKMNKDQFLVQFCAFLWILVCNIIAQVLIHSGVINVGGNWTWTIFLANVLFFIRSNPNQKEGLLEDACGGIFGLLGAIGLIYLTTLFPEDNQLLPVLIAIAVFLFLTIAIHPLLPYVFNNFALCFFLVALITHEMMGFLLTDWYWHIIGVILGNGIVNVGTILVVNAVLKRQAAKK